MPKIRLTQLAVEKLKPPAKGQAIFWDAHLPGFGVRVSALRPGREARKAWIAMYRVRGRNVMETLGNTAVIPNVSEARERARASILKARAGANPVAERRAEAAAAAAQAEAVVARAEAAALATFAAVAARYLREHVERNCAPSLIKETRRILDHDVLPLWGARQICEITRTDIGNLLDRKAARRERPRAGTKGGAAVQANRTLARLKTLFRWALDEGLIETDPTERVRRRVKEKARDRALGDDEIRWFWCACERIGWPFGPIGELLLLTAQRRDEVGGMRWAEIDLANRVWTIPRERAKNGKAHLVHLSAPAIEIIEALPRAGDLVFSTNGHTAAAGFSKMKERIDGWMTERLRVSTGDPGAGLAEWILHDLRRTATTGMARLNVPPHVVDKILNHISGTIRGVAAVYNRHTYLDEREAALEAWGRYVESLVRPAPANIVQLAAAR